MELDRRNFLKGSFAIGGMAALGGLAGCAAPKQAKDEKDTKENASTPNKKAIPKEFTDGKWIGTAMGHDDKLLVEALIDKGALKGVRVLRCDDTIGIGSVAAPMMAAKILEAQNLDVDTISGATTTSRAITMATEDAITNAGGKPDDFHKGAVAAPKGTPQTAEVDAVFVGAGTSGLVAATRLLEAGKKVILFEKQDIPGGSMSMTYSGVAAAGSELQTNYGLNRFNDSPMFNKDAMLGLMKKYIKPENDRFGGAMPYQSAMYGNSGSLVDWMHTIGVGFYSLGVNKAYGITPYLAPGCYMGGCGYAMQFLVDRVTALGGSIVYATKVTDLIKENDRVTGVKAEGKDGSTWTVSAKAVCLTSGGFAANKDMIKQYYPDYAEFTFNCAPGSTGDGIVLGQKAGAGIECMGRELGAFLSTTAQAGSRFEVAFLYQTTPGIMVNAQGDQFGNISSDNHGVMSRALRNPDNGGKFFHITDESGYITTVKNEAYAMDIYKCLPNRGDMVHYDSVEAAAKELGISNLQATLDTHNAHALAGEPDEFGRKKLPFLDMHDGVWVVSVEPTPYLTTGGLAIDPAAHVQTEAGAAIPGLYAAGDVCGSIEEKDGRAYAMGFDAAMNYGYIMAETVKAEM
ncbi:MAG: FAD-dependent oxidoreductase [Raoultibacter sp.]